MTNVSVITPFYNSAETLGRCIESVLRQTHTEFEYILADNRSTDGSSEIAQAFARRDDRVRYRYFDEHVPQSENYNRALRELPPDADYCKLVQADDYLYPDCLRVMAALGRRYPTAGVISAARTVEDAVDPSNADTIAEFTPGREICRATIRGQVFAFGSPTTVMYRADLVRTRNEFFRKGAFFDDTDAVLDLLQVSEFAFSRRILTHTARDPDSTFGRVISYDVSLLHRFITAHRIGGAFFQGPELEKIRHELRVSYFDAVARAIVRRNDRWPYLKFHQRVLKDSAGLKIRARDLYSALARRIAPVR